MRRAVALVLILLLLAGCGGGSEGPGGRDSSSEQARGGTTVENSGLRTVTIRTSGGQEVEVRVEIADTDAERARGLMGRTELAEDRGMLFVFEDEQIRSFWMRDTLIPLSIAFMDSGGRIVDIQDMKPLDDEPPNYVSAEPAQYALEVNEGFFEERGVEVGDRVRLPG